MDIDRKVGFDHSKGKELRLLCPGSCGTETRHIIIQSTEVEGRADYDEGFSIFWTENHQLVECQGCQEISYRTESSNSEDYDHNDQPVITVRLYPIRSKETLFTKDYLNAPRNLNRIYKEVIDCYNNQIFTMCAAGLRALVEGICAELDMIDGPKEVTKKDGTKSVKRGKDLEAKIAGLCEKEKLTQSQAQILHQFRYMGNEAVHELSMPSQEELKLAIQIVEHILDLVFEIPAKALMLEKSRSMKKKPSL